MFFSALTLITLLFYFTERLYTHNEHLQIVIISWQTADGTTVVDRAIHFELQIGEIV